MEPLAAPVEISSQLAHAVDVLARHLGDTVASVHLFGSAVEGGLKPLSDVDLLVTVHRPPSESDRHALMRALLHCSAPPGPGPASRLRPLEVTVLALPDIVPWRHPAVRQLQFGEWLRDDLASGRFEPPMRDHDLAILLTHARRHSVPLRGPDASTLLPAVPEADLRQALRDTVAQWHVPADWLGDERNIVLALARVGFTAATGDIAPKDIAAAWLLARLPPAQRSVLADARAAYLGHAPDGLAARPDEVESWIHHTRAAIDVLLAATTPPGTRTSP